MTTTHEMHLLSYVGHELAKTQNTILLQVKYLATNEKRHMTHIIVEELHEVNAAAQ